MRRRDDGGQRESEAIRRFILLTTQSGFQLIQQRQPRSSTPVACMRLWNLWIHERKTPQRNQPTFFRSLGPRNASQQTALFEEVNNFLQRTLNSSSSLAWSLFNRTYLSIVLGKAAYASKSTNLSSIYHCLLIIQFERCSKKYIYIQIYLVRRCEEGEGFIIISAQKLHKFSGSTDHLTPFSVKNNQFNTVYSSSGKPYFTSMFCNNMKYCTFGSCSKS